MKSKVLLHFKNTDRILYQLAKQHIDDISLTRDKDYFSALCRIIVGQQLSTKAADTIWIRVVDGLKPKRVNASTILKTPMKKLRSFGLSQAKANSLVDLSQRMQSKELLLNKLQKMNIEQLYDHLMIVKGIGPWSVEMFLMFSMNHPDIFSPKDLGLQKALQKHYGLRKLPSPKRVEQLTKKWSPYRTWAAKVLWRSLDNP